MAQLNFLLEIIINITKDNKYEIIYLIIDQFGVSIVFCKTAHCYCNLISRITLTVSWF